MKEFAMMKGLGDYLGLDLEIVGPEDVKEIHPLLDVDGEWVDKLKTETWEALNVVWIWAFGL